MLRTFGFVVHAEGDNAAGMDSGNLGDKVFDVGRVDVDPAHDNHVIHSAGDEQIAFFRQISKVFGVKPALSVHALGRGLLVLVVATHDAGTADGDLPHAPRRQLHTSGVDNLDLLTGERPAGGEHRIAVAAGGHAPGEVAT